MCWNSVACNKILCLWDWVSLKGIMNCLRLQAVGGVYSWKPDFEEQFTILTQIPNGLSVSHVCPFVLISPGLLSCWPDLRWERKECTGAFFFLFLFFWWVTQPNKNRRRGEGENTMACNPVPPPVLPENTPILHHIHWQLRVYLEALMVVNRYTQHYAIT